MPLFGGRLDAEQSVSVNLRGKMDSSNEWGSSEISLIAPGSVDLPCFDTTELYARAAVEFASG